MNETITVLNWNLEKGINLKAGARWVREQRPDLFFQQEVQPDQLAELEELLDMDGHIAVPRPGISNDKVIFVRRGGPLVCTEEYPQAWAPWHAPVNIAVHTAMLRSILHLDSAMHSLQRISASAAE